MKIVYSWLKDFVDIDVPVRELADALTGCGLEVDTIEYYRPPEGVVIAKVLEKEKHPDADRLSVCKVDAGAGEPLAVVCGAPNVQAGMHVPLATIGTVLGPDFTVKKAKVRGVESYGMLCSERELGISDDHSGLMDLPDTMVPGKPFSDYFPEEAVIEIELTPDRGDCLSMVGVAREVAARFGLPLKRTARTPSENGSDPVPTAISVAIDAPERCPRYTGRLVRGVTIAPSPQWLQTRLRLCGIRPISNVVDITNYILLHFGQPMHAFDYARISNHRIGVRTAGKRLAFTTLDGTERSLEADDLLITDGSGPVALAGIMGGAGSEITDTTSDVFLECAYFEPTGIRKTGKRLGLSTDSSYRFERGVDPGEGLIDALDTAAALLEELAGGTVAEGRIDVCPEQLEPKKIPLRTEKVAQVLGVSIPEERVLSFLRSLQIDCTPENNGTITCTVPLFRHDITIEEDLIEEVGRLYGYDNIPPSESMHLSLLRTLPEVERITDTIRSALAFGGLHEAVTNSMTSSGKCSLVTPDATPVALMNPLNPDMALMRTSLLGSLLDITAYNRNRRNMNNRFFEIGKVFHRDPDGNCIERTVIAMLIEGDIWGNTWNSPAQPVSFYVLKGIIEAFSAHVGFSGCIFSRSADGVPGYYGPEAASVEIGTVIKGYAGVISGKIAAAFEVKSTVCYAELDIAGLLSKGALPARSYTPLPRYPALERDFSFVMPEELSSSKIIETVRPLSGLIEEIYPFDVFRDEKLGSGRKSITFNVRFRSPEKTLADNDVEKLCDRIITTLENEYDVQLRS